MLKKIGRNEKCHCGSGKKYKVCCLLRDERNKTAMEESRELQNKFREEQERKAESSIRLETERVGEKVMQDRCKAAMAIDLQTCRASQLVEIECVCKLGEIIDAAIKELEQLPISESREDTLAMYGDRRLTLAKRGAGHEFSVVNEIFLDLLEKDIVESTPSPELAPEEPAAPLENEGNAQEPAETDNELDDESQYEETPNPPPTPLPNSGGTLPLGEKEVVDSLGKDPDAPDELQD